VRRRASDRRPSVRSAARARQRNDKIAQTLGHEPGHALNLAHISVAHACPPPVWTVMVTNYFQQTTLLTDCAWNNIPHEYTAAEIAALRVR